MHSRCRAFAFGDVPRVKPFPLDAPAVNVERRQQHATPVRSEDRPGVFVSVQSSVQRFSKTADALFGVFRRDETARFCLTSLRRVVEFTQIPREKRSFFLKPRQAVRLNPSQSPRHLWTFVPNDVRGGKTPRWFFAGFGLPSQP